MSDPTSIASIQRPNCGTELNICVVRISNVNGCFFMGHLVEKKNRKKEKRKKEERKKKEKSSN